MKLVLCQNGVTSLDKCADDLGWLEVAFRLEGESDKHWFEAFDEGLSHLPEVIGCARDGRDVTVRCTRLHLAHITRRLKELAERRAEEFARKKRERSMSDTQLVRRRLTEQLRKDAESLRRTLGEE
ncbi:MAG: hypothetical protein ACYS9X_20705 [Planctomycetota bacterium]|jgi:hypothetical protein